MNTLSKLLSSQARAELFRLLFSDGKKSLHLREMHRKSKLAIGTIQKEIAHLKEMDLVQGKRDGNRLYYTANMNHPLYSTICELVEKTSGAPEKIKEILSTIKGIECVFIFGSYAKGSEKAHSDIDLVIIGDVGLRTVSSKLKVITEQTDREINPHVYSENSWRQKLKKNDHFIKSVLKEKKIILLGDENVLS